MIRIIATIIITLFTFVTTLFAQNMTGDWYGQLDLNGTKLRINFHVTELAGVFKTTMDSPDQKAMGIPTTSTHVTKNTIEINLKEMQVSFIGKLKGEKIDGIFKQAGMQIPLLLTKQKIAAAKPKLKLQEPKMPYNYISEDVTFINKAANNIKLAGTLTLPKNIKNPVVVILISGSGPQNRNSEIFGHKPFLVLSDYLTNNGIAVLRFDDRGVAKSQGTQQNANSADFATDVEAAIAYLRTRLDINPKKIGLIGHSEGGFIAPMVITKDKSIAFFVSLAGPGVTGSKILLTQIRKMNDLVGTSNKVLDYNENFHKKIHHIVIKSKNKDQIKRNIEAYLKDVQKNDTTVYSKNLTDQMINHMISEFSKDWNVYFIKANPKLNLQKIKCPVLALNGSKDSQVLPKLNLNGFKQALKNNKDVTIKEIDGLNHLFQKCKTGAFSEYKQNEETFNENVMKIIVDWINKRF